MKKIITGCLLLLVSTHIYGMHNKKLAEKIIANGSIDIEKIKVLKKLGLDAHDQKEITRLILNSKKEQIAKNVVALVDAVEVPCKTLIGHKGEVNTLIELNDGNIASGSSDNTIKIWNPINGACKTTFTDNCEINSLVELNNGKLASVSNNFNFFRYGFIRIWNTTKGTCEKSIDVHEGGVTCLIQLKNGNIASASNDKTIKILDQNSYKCLTTLIGHGAPINILIELNNGKLVSSARDCIRIWNITDNQMLIDRVLNVVIDMYSLFLSDHIISPLVFLYEKITDKESDVIHGNCEKEINNNNTYSCSLSLIQLLDGRIAYGESCPGNINILDLNNGICEKTLCHENYVGVSSLIELKGEKILAGSRNGTITIWDTLNSTIEKTLINHNRSVNALIQLKNGKIVSGSEDGTTKIWDVKLLMAALKIKNEGFTFDELLQLLNKETTLTKMAVDKLYPFMVPRLFDINIIYKKCTDY